MSIANAIPRRSASAIARNLKRGRSHQQAVGPTQGKKETHMGGKPFLLSALKGALAVALILSAPAATVLEAQEKGGADITGPYDLVENWPQPINNDGWSWGGV